jgi:hypothetical protein
MTRRLCLLTVFALGVSSLGCNGDKSASGGQPRIKGGGDVDPKASGPVQGGGGKSAIKGND